MNGDDSAVDIVELDVDLTRHVDGEFEILVRARFDIERVLRHRMHVQLVGNVAGHLEHDRFPDGRLGLPVCRGKRAAADGDFDDRGFFGKWRLMSPRRLGSAGRRRRGSR